MTTSYQRINIDTFNEKQYFSEYHYYELYDLSKQYDKHTFINDYGKGNIKYYFKKIVLKYDEGYELPYMVVVEKLSKKEKLMLSNFCSCDYCESNVYIQLTSKPNNNGCILYDKYPRQKYIDQAKINMHNHYHKK